MSKRKRKKQPRKPLTEQQKRAAYLFFDAHGVGEIASLLGVHRTTVWRWYQRSDFQREIQKITDNWLRAKRRETLKEWHNSPEYKRQQRKKYYARRKLKVIEQKMSDAGNNGNMKAYRALCKEYDRVFSDAYCDGMSVLAFMNSFSDNHSRKSVRREKASKPVKYIIEFV